MKILTEKQYARALYKARIEGQREAECGSQERLTREKEKSKGLSWLAKTWHRLLAVKLQPEIVSHKETKHYGGLAGLFTYIDDGTLRLRVLGKSCDVGDKAARAKLDDFLDHYEMLKNAKKGKKKCSKKTTS